MPSFAELKQSRASRQRVRVEMKVVEERAQPAEAVAEASSSTTVLQPIPEPAPTVSKEVDEAGEADAGWYELPPSLILRKTTKGGRSLYAGAKIKAGTAVLRIKPKVAVLSSSELSSRCSNCALGLSELAIIGQDMKSLKRCTLCKVTHYCSVKCQKADWQAHKPECEAHRALRTVFIRSNPSSDPEKDRRWVTSESVRALGRLCWLRKAGRKAGKDSDEWEAAQAMESHTKRLAEKELLLVGQQVQHLRHYLAIAGATDLSEPVPANMEEYGFSSSAELLNLVSAFTVNSHTLSSPSLSPLGVATSPTAALFNHSCSPNCAVVFPRGAEKLEVVALRDIAEGQELLMSYVDVSLPREERQKDLKKRYGFDCDCTLCEETGVDPRWCVRHVGCPVGNSKGKAKMPDLTSGTLTGLTICDACNGAVNVDIARLSALIQRGRDLLSQDEKGNLDPQTGLKTLSSLLPPLLDLLPPSAYPLFPLLRLRALLLTPPDSPTALQTAISSYALAYSGAELIHPMGHPTLAIILAEWGKTLSMELDDGASKAEVMRRLMEAVVVLRKAWVACERGFGAGGGIVGREVEGLIRGCEGEIGVLRYAK